MKLEVRICAMAWVLVFAGCQAIGRSSERYELCPAGDGAAAYQRARLFIDSGNYASALPLLKQAIAVCPQFVPGHELYQDSAIRIGEAAEKEMRGFYAQHEDPSDSPLLPYLRSRLSDNNRDRLRLLDVATRRDQSFFRAYLAKARIYRQLRRTDRALDELRKAIRARSESTEANQAIAEVLVQLGRYREAAWHYRALAQLKPGSHAVSKDRLALLIYHLGELDEAEKIVDDLLAFDDLDVEVLMDKAAITWLRKDFTGALQIYQRVLRIDGHQSEAVLNIGNLYYQALAGGTEAGRREFWPKARLAYRYYLGHFSSASGFDQLDLWLGVPVRLRQIDALLGRDPTLEPRLGDFE